MKGRGQLAANINAAIQESGRTQRAVASSAKITENYMSQLVTGYRRNPSVLVLAAIARATRTTTSALVEGLR